MPDLDTFLCPRRAETHLKFNEPDSWRILPNGDKVCSFCGSLSWDDMSRLVKKSLETPVDALYRSGVEVDPSDKPYKVYVEQPGIRNATEGGIKFYMMHVPRTEDGGIDVSPEQQDEYKQAVRSSRKRFEAWMRGDS